MPAMMAGARPHFMPLRSPIAARTRDIHGVDSPHPQTLSVITERGVWQIADFRTGPAAAYCSGRP
jgi:hypothetical protein